MEATLMQATMHPNPVSKTSRWAGRALSGLVILFMIFDGVMKLATERHVVQSMSELGFPVCEMRGLGLLVLACTALYVAPSTAPLGAILLTAFLGGATAAKVRLGDPSLLFSVFMGVLVWSGLFLRDARVRKLTPFRVDRE
jgi:hypothetical protein